MLVDDDPVHLNTGKGLLKNLYTVFPISSGNKMFEMLEKVLPDLILLDIEMPEMNGYEVIKKLKADEKTAGIPVIFLSAHIDPSHELEGLGLGAADYIFKPFSPIILMRRIENHIIIASRQRDIKKDEKDFRTRAPEMSELAGGMQNSILTTLAELAEFPNDKPRGHITRIQKYVKLLIDRLISEKIYADETAGWDPASLVPASRLHDLGKIRIDNSLLNKPGRYSPKEFELVKNHTGWGREIIESMKKNTAGTPFFYHAKIFAAFHHEKWDGTGYPLGLKGFAIPLEGRLMAIADVYDALISKRPYKDPLAPEEAKAIVLSEKGLHFDPLLTDLFESLSGEFAEVAKTCV
ncbi:MAG: response regulator [Spirochaetaceae bacterium]|jgi:putative two-component system response regulator|nr:response regulator [Spirochaetaceae bacterium]